MSNYTITAESVINSVIQDGQVQTTNRGALLDYLNRTHLRMLRESQWLFLRSPEQRFITQPDVSSYWLGAGSPPAGCADTGLAISNMASIIPDYVFDLSNARQLTQDSEAVLTGPTLRYKDASYRSSKPRTFRQDYNNPGVLNLYPPPDNNNSYMPLPLSPVCNYSAGGVLAWDRAYFILVTIVDSVGNESVPCLQYSSIIVPSGNLLTVNPPSLDVSSATLVNYGYYNVYVATVQSGPFYLQNSIPIGIGEAWTEPPTGVTNTIGPSLAYNMLNTNNVLYAITVLTDGTLKTTSEVGGGAQLPLVLEDSSGAFWQVTIDATGLLLTTLTIGPVSPALYIADTNLNAWQLGVLTDGTLTTTFSGPSSGLQLPAPSPPQVSSLIPLLGYVIAFYYQQERTQITSSTDLLQIPYQYFDVVVAGVNYYANLYTSKADDLNLKAGNWKREFMEGLAQMRRDLRINFRNNDVIMPDPINQYQIGTQSGYSFLTQ
jgi:hypothetical protein